jgi:hypothetical protein
MEYGSRRLDKPTPMAVILSLSGTALDSGHRPWPVLDQRSRKLEQQPEEHGCRIRPGRLQFDHPVEGPEGAHQPVRPAVQQLARGPR